MLIDGQRRNRAPKVKVEVKDVELEQFGMSQMTPLGADMNGGNDPAAPNSAPQVTLGNVKSHSNSAYAKEGALHESPGIGDTLHEGNQVGGNDEMEIIDIDGNDVDNDQQNPAQTDTGYVLADGESHHDG